jgi:hypothetical protein
MVQSFVRRSRHGTITKFQKTIKLLVRLVGKEEGSQKIVWKWILPLHMHLVTQPRMLRCKCERVAWVVHYTHIGLLFRFAFSAVAISEMPVDPNEPVYCFCRQVSYGEMVACDNDEVDTQLT